MPTVPGVLATATPAVTGPPLSVAFRKTVAGLRETVFCACNRPAPRNSKVIIVAQAVVPAGSRVVSTLFVPPKKERRDESRRGRQECLRHVKYDPSMPFKPYPLSAHFVPAP